MKTMHLRKNLHELRLHRLSAFIAAILFSGAVATTWADALYIITDDNDSVIVLDQAAKTADLSSQLINVTTGRRGSEIDLSAGQMVTIRHGGADLSAQAKNESVSQLLERLHIEPTPLEMVAVDLSGGSVVLTVASDITYYETVTEEVAYTTRRVPNAEMSEGTERVVQAGQDGMRTSVYEIVWSNGTQLSRQAVEELDSTMVEEIVEYGTGVKTVAQDDALLNVETNDDGSGTLYFASGATLAFSAVRDMTATAYTTGHDGVGVVTASGTTVRVGTVAVDKRVIPLGTRMYIVADGGIIYGTAVAEDTGVRGEKVDLYYNTYDECIQFGRRGCTVYILE